MIYSIYGYGKMKTEASIGCAIRALGNGESVLFVQFLKDGTSTEVDYFKGKNNILVMNGDVDKITLPSNLTTVDKFKAQSLYNQVDEKLKDDYGLVILDEILPAVDMGLITIEQIEYLISKCDKMCIDLFMTGRVRQKSLRLKIAELSDVCTDAHCVKHNHNSHCEKCGKDYPYHYTYCCDCGAQLVESKEAKLGRDF